MAADFYGNKLKGNEHQLPIKTLRQEPGGNEP